MLTWVIANRQWLFSGIGVTIFGAVALLLRAGYRKWLESQGPQNREVNRAPVKRPSLGSRLPGVLLRVLYSPAHVRESVRIGLRENAPGQLYLNNLPPFVDLYFQITNLGPVDLVLDRALVDVWFGQPTFSAALLDRVTIPAGAITDGIYLRQMLADNQKLQIEAFAQASRMGSRLHITITAYFESKLGRFSVRRSIERDAL